MGAALLLLLGVKHSLLSFHLLYQFLDPIKCKLIGDLGRQALVMLDLAINFDALITHRSSAFARGRPNSCRLDDAEAAVLFQYSKLGPLRVETGQYPPGLLLRVGEGLSKGRAQVRALIYGAVYGKYKPHNSNQLKYQNNFMP
jgi:hypothetical protein